MVFLTILPTFDSLFTIPSPAAQPPGPGGRPPPPAAPLLPHTSSTDHDYPRLVSAPSRAKHRTQFGAEDSSTDLQQEKEVAFLKMYRVTLKQKFEKIENVLDEWLEELLRNVDDDAALAEFDAEVTQAVSDEQSETLAAENVASTKGKGAANQPAGAPIPPGGAAAGGPPPGAPAAPASKPAGTIVSLYETGRGKDGSAEGNLIGGKSKRVGGAEELMKRGAPLDERTAAGTTTMPLPRSHHQHARNYRQPQHWQLTTDWLRTHWRRPREHTTPAASSFVDDAGVFDLIDETTATPMEKLQHKLSVHFRDVTNAIAGLRIEASGRQFLDIYLPDFFPRLKVDTTLLHRLDTRLRRWWQKVEQPHILRELNENPLVLGAAESAADTQHAVDSTILGVGLDGKKDEAELANRALIKEWNGILAAEIEDAVRPHLRDELFLALDETGEVMHKLNDAHMHKDINDMIEEVQSADDPSGMVQELTPPQTTQIQQAAIDNLLDVCHDDLKRHAAKYNAFRVQTADSWDDFYQLLRRQLSSFKKVEGQGDKIPEDLWRQMRRALKDIEASSGQTVALQRKQLGDLRHIKAGCDEMLSGGFM